MLDHADPVASIIPAMSLDSPSDSAMAALTRAALGPVNTDYYLSVFERFDTRGHATTTWNWAAFLCTFNWMLFRQLWSPALVYVAAAEGVALIAFGIGRTFLEWPQGVELGVVGAFALLAFAVPGLYGNAILHADVRKRVARALAESRTVPHACELLEKQASSRRRLNLLVGANVALALAAAAAYLVWSPSPAKPLDLEPAKTVAQTLAEASNAAADPAPAPSPATSPAPVSASATAPAAVLPQPIATASASPEADKAWVSAPQPFSTSTAVPQAHGPATAAPVPQGVPPTVAPSEGAEASVAPTAPASTAPPPAADAAAARDATPHRARSTPRAAAKSAGTSSPGPAAPVVGKAPGFYINVGLFADVANARKAQARLLNEGLPAFRQELQTANGRRLRVRVGPYASRLQADAAAVSIRAMALEAVVFRQ